MTIKPTPAPINSPYLRSQREFPQDSPQALSVQIDKAYIDIAQKVNARTIGVFPTNRPIINGEAWFLGGPNQKQQALRQVYPFTYTSSPLNIPHGINISQISGFVRIWGTFVDSGSIWYPIPYVDTVATNNEVSVKVDGTNIIITVGPITVAGPTGPTPKTGFVILEWLANV